MLPSMDWLRFQPGSINDLTQTILSLVVTLLLWRGRSSASRLLAWYHAASTLALFGAFLYSCVAVDWYPAFVPLEVLPILAGELALFQFAYTFPQSAFERERPWALGALGVLNVIGLGLIWPFWVTAMETREITTAYAIFGLWNGLLVLGMGWVVVVLLRQTVRWDAGPRPFWQSWLTPQTPAARAARAMLVIPLLTLIPVSLAIAHSLGAIPTLLYQYVFTATIITLGVMFIGVYLNFLPETHTFLAKLSVSALTGILAILGIVGLVTSAKVSEVFTLQTRLWEAQVQNALLAATPMTTAALPPEVAYVARRPANDPRLDFELWLTQDPQLTPTAFAATFIDSYPVIGKSVRQSFAWPDRYVFSTFALNGQEYELGVNAHVYRAKTHEGMAPLIYLILLASALVMGLFPVLLNNTLVYPLHTLLQGVRQVNSGQRTVSVPVQYQDEIGYLTESFNGMVASLRESDVQKDALTEAYARFVPHEFLQQLGRDSITEVGLGDLVQREMTVLFVDVRNFTTLAERLSPQAIFDLLNRLLGAVSPMIREQHGFIDKYLGDGVMALFPRAPADAVRAAIAIRRALNDFNVQRSQPLEVGMGLHTGSLVLGTVGEAERMDGTVIADAVNVAARLQVLTKRFGVSAITTTETLAQLPFGALTYVRPLGLVRVRGRQQSLRIFEIFEGAAPAQVALKYETRHDFEGALQAYYARDFAKAQAAWAAVLQHNPNDRAVQYFIAQCTRFLQSPPPADWDGVEAMD